MPVPAQRAEEMAPLLYSKALLAPYVAQIAEQAERIGWLEAELAAARANGQAAGRDDAPQAEPWPEGRRWWQKLLWG